MSNGWADLSICGGIISKQELLIEIERFSAERPRAET